MGSTWAVEARHRTTGELIKSWTEDGSLQALASSMEAEPDLPEDASLAWCDTVRFDRLDDPEYRDRYRWAPSEVVPSVRWLRDLAARGDPRFVPREYLERGLQSYLAADFERLLQFLLSLDETCEIRSVSCP